MATRNSGPGVKDKLVLVTGAGRGIGKRLALGFAAEGAHIGLVARSRPQLDLTHIEIEHAGGSSARYPGDVRDREFLAETVRRMSVQFARPVEILICAAAVQGPVGPLLDADPRAWWEAIEINFGGAVNAARAVLPGMIEARAGKIILLTGGGAARPRPFFTAYAAAKAALARFAESLAEEVQEHNIQVNCLSPGGTYTAMTDEILRAGARAGWKDLESAREVRLTGGVAPEKQLRLAMFLASSRSNHISGRLLHVHDDWERLADATLTPEAYTLRRLQKG
jgi:NAD(P)-dependent dehydrogenase (short-subunit alcohol dehydrogenase family)